MPRTTIVSGRSVTVTTTETNLLQNAAITVATPIGDVDSYAIVVANTGAVDITLRMYLQAGTVAGLRIQSAVTATVAAGAAWSYQLSGNAMRGIVVTGQTGASTTTVVCDMDGVVYP